MVEGLTVIVMTPEQSHAAPLFNWQEQDEGISLWPIVLRTREARNDSL